MERSFIATKESEYVENLDRCIEIGNQQKKFVKKFFIEKGIDSSNYMVGGNGLVGVAFNEYDKNEITLSIEPTENNLANFKKMLCKPNKNHGMCAFKKSSSIAKEFAQKCIDEQIVINLYTPRISDYFPTLGYHGCSYTQFPNGDDLYIKVDSEYLKGTFTPEGFIEIKLSDYYIAKEKFESSKENS